MFDLLFERESLDVVVIGNNLSIISIINLVSNVSIFSYSC